MTSVVSTYKILSTLFKFILQKKICQNSFKRKKLESQFHASYMITFFGLNPDLSWTCLNNHATLIKKIWTHCF